MTPASSAGGGNAFVGFIILAIIIFLIYCHTHSPQAKAEESVRIKAATKLTCPHCNKQGWTEPIKNRAPLTKLVTFGLLSLVGNKHFHCLGCDFRW